MMGDILRPYGSSVFPERYLTSHFISTERIKSNNSFPIGRVIAKVSDGTSKRSHQSQSQNKKHTHLLLVYKRKYKERQTVEFGERWVFVRCNRFLKQMV